MVISKSPSIIQEHQRTLLPLMATLLLLKAAQLKPTVVLLLRVADRHPQIAVGQLAQITVLVDNLQEQAVVQAVSIAA